VSNDANVSYIAERVLCAHRAISDWLISDLRIHQTGH
jgi:hypothetical protein